MSTDKKTVTTIVSAGNFDQDFVIDGLKVELKFKSISDGGSVNQATYKIEGGKHTLDFTGVTYGQMLVFGIKGIRVDLLQPRNKWTKSDAETFNGGTTLVKDMFNKAGITRVADPVAQIAKLDMTKPECLHYVNLQVQYLQAVVAGAATPEMETTLKAAHKVALEVSKSTN
jgi:hypothetical protein